METLGRVEVPLPEELALGRLCGRRSGRARGVASLFDVVHLEQEGLGAAALPHVAAVVGAVGHVVAIEIHEEAILRGVLDVLTEAAVALDAGAHADTRALLQATRDVGIARAAADGAQEQVVHISAVLLHARVTRDGADAGHLDVVAVAHKDTTALVVGIREVADVAGDDAAVDDALVVVDIDGAGILICRVSREGALGDGRRLLIELDGAGIVGRVIVTDYEALDETAVLARLAVDMNGAAALAPGRVHVAFACRRVIGDSPRLILGDDGELALVDVEATATPRDVAVDDAVFLYRDGVVRAV